MLYLLSCYENYPKSIKLQCSGAYANALVMLLYALFVHVSFVCIADAHNRLMPIIPRTGALTSSSMNPEDMSPNRPKRRPSNTCVPPWCWRRNYHIPSQLQDLDHV